MSTPSVASDRRYVLTTAGRELLADHVRCQCEIRVSGLLFECAACGTIYGHFAQVEMRGYGSAKRD